MTLSGRMEFPISSSGSVLVNRTMSTCRLAVKGKTSAIFLISLVRRRPFSPAVHLHSPTRICFLSSDSATTSISTSLYFPSTSTCPHHRLASPYVIPLIVLPVTASRQSLSHQYPHRSGNSTSIRFSIRAVLPSSRNERLADTNL